MNHSLRDTFLYQRRTARNLLRGFSGALLAVLMGWTFLAVAQTPAASPTPSVEDIVNKLKLVDQPAPLTRSLGQGTGNADERGISVEGQRKKALDSPSIDLDVNFEYASAALSPDAKIILDNLGKALTDPALVTSSFLVGGHTDARGSDAYNQKLSVARAQAVASYLMREYGIQATRLKVEGYGRSRLLDPANPDSVVNRRVEVTNLGAGGHP